MPDEIRLGVTVQDSDQAQRDLSSLYRSAQEDIFRFGQQADDFSARWSEIWESEGPSRSLDAFVRGGVAGMGDIEGAVESADESLKALQDTARQITRSMREISEQGIDTSDIEQKTQNLQTLFERLRELRGDARRAERDDVPGGEQLGAEIQTTIGTVRGGIDELIGSLDKAMPERPEEPEAPQAPTRPPFPTGPAVGPSQEPFVPPQATAAPGPGVPSPSETQLDRLGQVVGRLIESFNKLNQQTDEETRRKPRRRPPSRQLPQLTAGERFIQEQLVPRMPGGMVGRAVQGRISGRIAAMAAGRAAGGAAGGAAAGAAGGVGVAGLAMVAAPLAALAGGALLYRGLRGKAEQFERTAVGVEQLGRRFGVETPQQFGGIAGMMLPGGRAQEQVRYRGLRERYGIGREQFIQALGGIEAPRMVGVRPGAGREDVSRDLERTLGSMGFFARRQGRDISEVGQVTGQLGRAGVGAEDLEMVLNRTIGQTMTAGVERGIARSDTMSGILTATSATVRNVGELTTKGAANAAAMIEAFTASGVGGFMRGGAGQRMVGAIQGGADDPTKFAMFFRAIKEAAGERGKETQGFREFLTESYGQMGDDPAMTRIFGQLQTTMMVEQLQKTLNSNPELLTQVLPGIVGGPDVSTSMKMLRLGKFGIEGPDALQTIAFLQGGMGGMGTLTLGHQIIAGQKKISEEEQQQLKEYREDPLAFQRAVGPERFEEIERLSKAQKFARGRQVAGETTMELPTLSKDVEQILQIQSAQADVALNESKIASQSTAGMAKTLVEIRDNIGTSVQTLVNAFQGKGALFGEETAPIGPPVEEEKKLKKLVSDRFKQAGEDAKKESEESTKPDLDNNL